MRVNKLIAIYNKTNGKCFYCGTELNFEHSSGSNLNNTTNFCVDHFRPKYYHGSEKIENLFPSCVACNSKKGKLFIEKFRLLMAFDKFGIPRFSEEQIKYLKSVGFVFDKGITDYKFWFEENTNYRIENRKIVLVNNIQMPDCFMGNDKNWGFKI